MGTSSAAAYVKALDGRQSTDNLWIGINQHRRKPFGTFENAVVAAIMGNTNQRPQVNGFVTPDQVATYTDRDATTLYIDMEAPAPTQTVAAISFTATTVLLASAASVDVVNGMLIDTNDATKFTGQITGISANRMILTVSGWYQVGNTAAGQVPSGTPTLYINPITKVWGQDTNIYLGPTSLATRGTGYEIGLVNSKGPVTYGDGSSGPSGGINVLWGYDVVGLGPYPGANGFRARTNLQRGFASCGNIQYAFAVEDNAQNPVIGFVSEATTGIPFAALPGGVKAWSVDTQGGMDLGRQSGTATAAALRMHGKGSTTTDLTLTVRTDGNSVFTAAAGAVMGFGALTDLGNEALRVQSVTSQVNGLRIIGAVTGSGPQLIPLGSDTNIPLFLQGKGSGVVQVGAAGGTIGFFGGGGTTKQTVTGSISSGAATANLFTYLHNIGFLVNGTTA